jgi:hypothetical protein
VGRAGMLCSRWGIEGSTRRARGWGGGGGVGASGARRGLVLQTGSVCGSGLRRWSWSGACGWGWVWGGGVVGWSLVVNCIVDASILFSVVLCVVKLSRADGGCLGTGSR